MSPVRSLFGHWRLATLAFVALLLMGSAAATAFADPSPLHPTFPFLDEDGLNVLESGKPVSTMQTCGACHDTAYIESHSYHTSLGSDHMVAPGQVPDGRPWDMSRGLFGQWDPINYRYLTPKGDELFDLGTPDWIKLFGERHAGGGPAVLSQDGLPLAELEATPGDPETSTHDPNTGTTAAWDWSDSGTVEMNCFLCHMPQSNNDARVEELQAGDFGWADTATLLGTGIVEKQDDGWTWNRDAFQENGELAPEFVTLQGPTSTNCGQCHGAVHESSDPLICADIKATDWNSMRTGQIYSGQRLSDSGMNMAGKESLTLPWDIHAERNLRCTDCHFSLNNPDYQQESDLTRPDYLTYDPRRQDIGAYLYRPSHQFAKGDTAQHTLAPEFSGSMRQCEDCHSIEETHDWLPYKETHMNAVRCESCHVPKMYTAGLEQNDWTVLTLDGQAQTTHRGVEGECGNPRDLMTGYQPVLLPFEGADGQTRLAPFNLITSWYWVHGDPERPVRIEDLTAVYLDGDSYHPEILAAFDANHDGQIDEVELRLDSDAKTALIQQKLQALGLQNPRILGEVLPYNISHNIVSSDWATKDCDACHSEDSRVAQGMILGPYTPGGVLPAFGANSGISQSGQFTVDDSGALLYEPNVEADGLYLPGHNNVPLVDIIGWLAVLGVLLGIIVHGGYRLYQAARYPRQEHELKEVYMYTFYERLWHWTQAIVILLLIATGIVIHRPDWFGWADFGLMVPIHNILSILLVINALFAVFYHFASGEIKQYLPEPHGFFRRGITQVDFYLRGIFRGEDHPFEKTPEQKLNPLQQVTYFAILNILLPLQILTGLFMFGTRWWPQLAIFLPILAPLHTLVAWFFVAFVILHVYLTTTGSTVTADLEGMITGWDKVEVHEHPAA
ncbi:MAG: cytochrome b/b6 domain-containing protein [Chloroflexota bacterium]|nr:cytochrome b/b6 domain-containing protein [Chloroflexota bacterium]